MSIRAAGPGPSPGPPFTGSCLARPYVPPCQAGLAHGLHRRPRHGPISVPGRPKKHGGSIPPVPPASRRRRCSSMENRWRKRKAHAEAWPDQGEDSVSCCAFRRIGASESHPQQPHPGQEPFLMELSIWPTRKHAMLVTVFQHDHLLIIL